VTVIFIPAWTAAVCASSVEQIDEAVKIQVAGEAALITLLRSSEERALDVQLETGWVRTQKTALMEKW
jgi:hypothetical protein